MTKRDMRRRDILKIAAGLAMAPGVSRAQQTAGGRLVALVFGSVAGDPDADARILAIRTEMQRLGWAEGRNIRFELFFAENSAEKMKAIAGQILAAAPDVILCSGTVTTVAMHAATKSVPIVFVNVTDPVAGGFVASLARPGGNITGFTPFEYPIAGKWLERLRGIAPDVSRVAMLGDPLNHNFRGFWAEFETEARKEGILSRQAPVGNAGEIERNMRAIAQEPNGGLIISAAQFSLIHRALIVRLADELKLPAIYWSRFFPESGGLVSYGPNSDKLHARSATYIDQILRGEKPDNLPVQQAVDFETVLNAKTARALGLSISPLVLAVADEVIE